MTACQCVFCGATLLPLTPIVRGSTSEEGSCPRCYRSIKSTVFPALFGSVNQAPPEIPSDAPLEPGEVACFYSPNRRATKECAQCGVFISDLWAAQWGARTYCLKCLEHLRNNSTDKDFRTSIILWDKIAMALALFPCTIIFWVFGFLTAPASLIIALWNWNSPRSIVYSSRFTLICAIVIASIQVIIIILTILGQFSGTSTFINNH